MKRGSIDVALIGISLLVVSAYALTWRLAARLKTQPPQASAALASAVPSSGLDAAPSPSPAAAAVPAKPVAGPSEEEWNSMTHDLARLAASYPGHVAVDLEDLDGGRSWAYHADDLFPSASLIKVPVMAGIFSAVRQGRLSLDDALVLRRRDRVGGSGSLKWMPDGTRFTVRELLKDMIRESDNVALTMLLDAADFDFVRHQFPDLGLVYTGLNRQGLSLKSGRVAHENYTTAREMTMLMVKIYRGELLDQDASRQMLGLLEEKKPVATRLEKGLPRGWMIAHKTGLERRACHDCAIFFTPHGRYAMTVLTGHNPNYKMAKNFIVRLGHVTFRYWGGEPRRYYARAYSRNRRTIVR